MTRFGVTLRCTSCGTRYKRTMTAPDEETLAALPDPPCPTCNKKAKRRKFDFASGKAPATGGALSVRAVDETARIVMEDHGMTDLRSDVREGESAAPKLPPAQQAMADNFFKRGQGAPSRMRSGMFGMNPNAVRAAAVAGRFRTPDTVDPVALQHSQRKSVPTNLINPDPKTWNA